MKDNIVYVKKPVEKLTDTELQHKICRDVRGGCAECEVRDTCRYGTEWLRRMKKCG